MSVSLQTGIHAIVVSGYIGLYLNGQPGVYLGDPDDDNVHTWQEKQAIGPLWHRIQQVSASVSQAGIISRESDEVDHSRWVVKECSWNEVDVEGGKKIQLNVKLDIQGFQNGWINLAYQVVATGDLRSLPTPDEISADLS